MFQWFLAALFALTSAPQPVFVALNPAKTGIAFHHNNAKSPRRYLPESMGPGVAIFDYDNDGWTDVYFTNSGPADLFQPNTPLRNPLYHNNHDGTFTDVTIKAGVQGLAVTTCDYNYDGWTDLFITNYGVSILYRKRLAA